MISGIMLLDKPQGSSSADALHTAANRLGVSKAGHSGVLDRAASGLLLAAFGDAVKAMPIFAGLEKEYDADLFFHQPMDRDGLDKAVRGLEGRIKQTPPRKALVARREREREIMTAALLSFDGRLAKVRIRCEAGLYIRKLASDLGAKLGTGAQLAGLRRIAIGPFGAAHAVPPEQANMDRLMTIWEAANLIGCGRITARHGVGNRLARGAVLQESDMEAYKSLEAGKPCVIFLGTNAIALGTALTSSTPAARIGRVFKHS
ncbi:MAG: hypothetical protein HY519_00775 [Candidatus Aenigmarchaeota archaeon]|nr:hypothetical protein [Candidatus Aenigmarchaeota archaeon]